MGPLALYNYYFEHKRQQEEAMKRAKKAIVKTNDAFEKISGRRYGDGLLQPYKLDDAEVALICMGSTAGTARTVVDEYRERGLKVGLVKLRAFRPFPITELTSVLRQVKVLGVLDRSGAYGAFGGPLFNEIRSALYNFEERPIIVDYIYGLGGRDMPPPLIGQAYEELKEILKSGEVKQEVKFLGVR
jgi:pyruvate ferredoxin oxidoreductase alpha subunit